MSAGTERRAQIDAALASRNIDPAASNLSRYQLKELIRVVEILGGRIEYDAAAASDTAAVAASLDTDSSQPANAAIIWTAGTSAAGAKGNDIRIVYAGGATAGAETMTYAVSKLGIITITVGIQDTVSTATQVLAKVASEAGTLVTAALKAGNSGAGAVTTFASTALTGGADLVQGDEGNFVITPAA